MITVTYRCKSQPNNLYFWNVNSIEEVKEKLKDSECELVTSEEELNKYL